MIETQSAGKNRHRMKKIILPVLAVILIALAAPAGAQDVLPDKVLPDAARNTDELQAEDSKRVDYANMYYKRCMSVPMPDVGPATQDLTCMCHTVHMVKALKMPELELMGTGKGSMNVNPIRLNVDVYAPCVEFAITEIETNNCYSDRAVTSRAKNQTQFESVCDCIGDNIATVVRETAVPQIAAIQSEPQGVTDPVQSIRRSYAFAQERLRIRQECINEYIN
jgi:hypothetical protein